MKVLVVGGGGREHAIVWKLSQSKRITKLYCAPGNAGIAKLAQCVPYKATELEPIVRFAKSEQIDLVFVAPDDPLAMGLVNILTEEGIRVFGPTREAAIIEASKSFSKNLMKKYNIPTANYEIFADSQKASDFVDTLTPPIVVKADGLALGKGVIIAASRNEAKEAIRMMLEQNAFGTAGNTILIEEFLTGRELTVLAFSDGKTVAPMINSRDHKKAFDGDLGLNTGGMGAICPGEELTVEMEEKLHNQIFLPTIKAMHEEGRDFKGVIYFGLMLTPDGPKVIEYNARFGDPEAQAVLPLLETDLLDIIDAVIDEKLSDIDIKWKPLKSCCVVMASGGYPDKYEVGMQISGLEEASSLVFHAGTKFGADKDSNKVLTNGGRVLGVTALAPTLEEAIDKAYFDVNKISFNKMHFRKDIGRTHK